MSTLQPNPGTLKPDPANYLWSDFLTAVNGFLTVDLNRQGSNFDTFKLTQIRAALQVLQTFVPQYQVGHETVYGPQDTVKEGFASRFVKPPQSIIRDIYLCKTGCGPWPFGCGPSCPGGPPCGLPGMFQGNAPEALCFPPTGVSNFGWQIVTVSGQVAVTITSTNPHGLAVNQPFVISGSSNAFLNGNWKVATVVSPTVFTFNLLAAAPATVTDTTSTTIILPLPTSPSRTAVAMRWQTDPWPWEDRFALIMGKVPLNRNRGYFCIDPQGYTAYIYPEVFDCWLLSVWWDGLKLEFQPGDETPFDEMTALAAASYLKAQIAMEVQERPDLYEVQMKQFATNKTLCWLRERDKTQAKG